VHLPEGIAGPNMGNASGEPANRDAPHFLLLEGGGPRPGALGFSFGCLSGFLTLVVSLTHPPSATQPRRAELISEIVLRHEPLWLPAPSPREARGHASPLSAGAKPAEAAPRLHPSSDTNAPAETLAKADQADRPVASPAPVQSSVLPLPSSDLLSRVLTLIPGTSGTTHTGADALNPAQDALGTLKLPRLIQREAALAASLAALPADRRLALPTVSIRVNAEWLAALPQTQEKLYFSVATPQAGNEVLRYLPATHTFILERPLRPLWQIRDPERVAELVALRSAVARRLGVPPEIVGLYTWHPPLLENALRMFVLERMKQMGVRLGPRDVVTVRLASGPDGWVMNLEPIRGSLAR